MPVSNLLEERMLTRRRFLGYTALAPAVLRSSLWANPTGAPRRSAGPPDLCARMGRA